MSLLATFGLLAMFVLPAASADVSRDAGHGARATIEDLEGRRIGTVRLTERHGSVTIRADVRNLEPGFHGFHVHGTGLCEPPFTSAGGHFNPDGITHGDHAGDMPSLLVMDDGAASLAFETDRFALSDLFDEDGSAVIVHADPDNSANVPDRYHSHDEDVFGPDSATQATGDAGGRVACGVIRR